jgi:hypothetical protein
VLGELRFVIENSVVQVLQRLLKFLLLVVVPMTISLTSLTEQKLIMKEFISIGAKLKTLSLSAPIALRNRTACFTGKLGNKTNLSENLITSHLDM